MSLDLYQRETADKLAGMAPVQVPEAGAWDGFVRGTGLYSMQSLAKTGRAIDLVGSVGPIVTDAFTGGTEAQDKYFREHDEVWGSAVKYWTPEANEVGVAGQTVGQLVGLLPQVLASPGLAVAGVQLGTGEDLVNQGVDATRANLAGAVQGAGLGVGIWMPVLGNNLWQRVLIGGAAFNAAQGVVTRAATGALLSDTPAAGDFKAFDGQALTLDVLLGAAFGSLVHLSPEARAQGASAWETLRDWATNFKPSDVDAIAALRQAQHMNVDSTPGKPVDPSDVEAHVERLKTAIEQLERGKPVDVTDMPAGKFEPDQLKVDQNREQLTNLVHEAEQVRAAEGIVEPTVPDYLRTTPEMERTFDDLQKLPREEQAQGVGDVIEAQLRRIGVDPVEAQANAAIWQAFAQTAGDRYGINPADVLTRYGVGVSRGTPLEGGLEQGGSQNVEAGGKAGTDAKTYFQNTPAPEPFYSELARQVDGAQMKQGDAKAWKDWVKSLGSKGVKADEIKWSGLEEWLDLQGGKITKDQVQEFLRNNGVKVEEVMLGDRTGPTASDLAAMDRTELAKRYEEEIGYNPIDDNPAITEDELRAQLEDIYDQPESAPAGEAKFSAYQLPGGENYRELLLTLPKVKNSDRGTAYEREHGTDFQSSHFDEPNILAHVRFNERTDADGKRVLFVEEFQSDWAQQGRKKGFIKQDESVKVRRIEDRPGIGEQWVIDHEGGGLASQLTFPSEAAARGYITSGVIPSAPFVGKTEAWVALTLKRMIRYAAENGFDRLAWTKGEQQVERYTQALRKAVDAIEWKKTKDGVHIVGYKGRTSAQDSQHARQLRDNVAGIDQEIHRFLDLVGERTGSEDPREMDAITRGQYDNLKRRREAALLLLTEAAPPRDKVVDTTEKEDFLSDAIGKSMAERIRNDPAQSGTIEGEAVNVSDTGMASFYDRIVPNVAKDVLKKLGGGKVTEVKLPEIIKTDKFSNGQDGGTYQEAAASTQPGLDITPAMREKAMAGQPLFQGGRGQIHFGDQQTLIHLFENADRSTFVHETGHFFLQATRDFATAPNAPAAAIRDWSTIAQWLELDGDTIPRQAHEQFARGFEAYLMEGKAPSPMLRTVFQQFRDWLLAVYHSIADLKVELTDDIRGVMDRMLTSQSQDPAPGAPRSAPPEPTAGDGSPPPSGEGGTASEAAGFTPMTTDQPEMHAILDQMAKKEAGWEQEGGKHLGGPAGTPNFSTWIPKADWWAGRPDKLNAAKVQEAVRKAIAGEPLKKAEQRTVDYMTEVANQRLEQTKTVMDAMKPAKDGSADNPEAQAPDALSMEAERYVMDHPDQLVTIGTNPDGSPAQMTARQYLEEARAASTQARDDAKLFEVAATCLMGRS